jgi:hypothetical protein
MSGKEQFQKIKKETPYISKDGKFYAIKFYDEKNDCCHYRVTDSHKGRNEKDIPTYEDAYKLYNIELEETIPTPDQYFLKKVDEESNTNILRTVSDATFIRYTKDHKEDCTESIEKLKTIVCTHKDKKVRKAAYESCVEIGIDNVEELHKYINNPENMEIEDNGINQTDTKKSIPNRTNPLNKEKAIIIYMTLVKRYKEHRENITCGVFLNAWKEIFECDKYNVSKESYKSLHDKQIVAFAYVKGEFDDKSYEEIKAIRDTFIIYPSREVPTEIKQLAQSKGVIVTLAENIDKHLSGFNVLVKESRYMTYKINDIPYGLSENATKRLLESLPTKSEIVKKEKALMDTLRSETLKVKQKKAAVNSYKAPYATHEFKKFMNRFTIYNCTNQQLTLFCVNLCKRVGINNLSNELPIEYKFCVGSGKRKQTMKRINNRKKGNKKAAKKRKGR